MSEPANDPLLEQGVASLDDAVTTPPLTDANPPAPPPPSLTNEQIIGVVAMFSSMGLPPEVSQSYVKDLTDDFTLKMLVEMSGLASGLAEYGIGGGGGVMPPWMKVLLGTAALGFFVWQKRLKYGITNAEPTAAAAGSGFAGAWGFGDDTKETYDTAKQP